MEYFNLLPYHRYSSKDNELQTEQLHSDPRSFHILDRRFRGRIGEMEKANWYFKLRGIPTGILLAVLRNSPYVFLVLLIGTHYPSSHLISIESVTTLPMNPRRTFYRLPSMSLSTIGPHRAPGPSEVNPIGCRFLRSTRKRTAANTEYSALDYCDRLLFALSIKKTVQPARVQYLGIDDQY